MNNIPMQMNDGIKSTQWTSGMVTRTPTQYNSNPAPMYHNPVTSINLQPSTSHPIPGMQQALAPGRRSLSTTQTTSNMPIIPQRNISPHNVPLFGPLSTYPMTAYSNYQQPTSFLPAVMQLPAQNGRPNYDYPSVPNSYLPVPAKQPQPPMMTPPREFEAAFTPFLINSPDFSMINANQTAQPYGSYAMLGYSAQSRQYDPPKNPKPTTFVPYVNSNAK